MSIGAMGASGSGNLNQILASLLSRIDPSTTSTDDTDDTDFTPDAGSAPCNNALTGSTSAQLSGSVLGVLMGLQQQSGTQPSGSAASSATGSNPLDQLFTAMDSDGDGSVSQSEMETYLGQQGATTGQADALFASLDQNGSGGISESQMGSALQQSAQVHRGGGGGHHHHHGTSGTSSAADTLLQAMDADNSGSVSQDEFSDFVTQNGGTTSEADTDFAALDASGTGTLNSADFMSAIQKYQSNMGNGASSPMLNLLDAFAQNATPTAITA